MKSLIVFLTHNFKPIFRQTLSRLESSLDSTMDSIILMDSSAELPADLKINIPIVQSRRYPSSFDPLGQAHNFYLDFFKDNKVLGSYDYIWILENDVYYHGNIREFFDIHEKFDYDLLVPEYGLRHKDWCWLNGTQGIRNIQPIGATAVIYRTTSKFMEFVVNNANTNIKGHMEVTLPHMCIENGFSIQQFIPDHMCSVRTYKTPMIDLVERDLIENTNNFVGKKLYHPIKI